jgi:hypothetical protein
MPDRDKPPEPERCEQPELRFWYSRILGRIKAHPKLPVGEVIASWRRVARPMVTEVPEPSTDERRRHPGRYIRTVEGPRVARLREVPTEYDGPMAKEPDIVVYLDRMAFVSHGQVIHDRERVLAVFDPEDPLWQLVADILPSGRSLGARKGAHPDTVARALLLWSLRSLGLRRAARCVIVWDDDLGSPLADRAAADLVRRFQALEEVTKDERRLRGSREATVITTSKRIWKTIGLQEGGSLRI